MEGMVVIIVATAGSDVTALLAQVIEAVGSTDQAKLTEALKTLRATNDRTAEALASNRPVE